MEGWIEGKWREISLELHVVDDQRVMMIHGCNTRNKGNRNWLCQGSGSNGIIWNYCKGIVLAFANEMNHEND